MRFTARPATDADVPALTGLQQRFDIRWFGEAEHDEDEVREALERAAPADERTRVLVAGDLVLAGAWWHAGESWLVPPDGDPSAAYDDLLPWLAAADASVESLAVDEALRAALARHGWRYVRSSYELIADAAVVTPASFPAGVTVTGLRGEPDRTAVYRLIYDEAGWETIPGHSRRPYESWRELFVPDTVDARQQVLAWDGDRLVGAALGKTFSDRTGWVAQVAVAPERQGGGLGSALIREAFGRRVGAGATSVGLGVSADNPDALRLYRRLGLEVDREWMVHRATAA